MHLCCFYFLWLWLYDPPNMFFSYSHIFFYVRQWTNDEDGVARYLEYMESEGYFESTAV